MLKKVCKQIELNQFGLVVVITTSEGMIERTWAGSRVLSDKSDIRREVFSRIVPLINNGSRKGDVCLKGIRLWTVNYIDNKENYMMGTIHIPVFWQAMLPWWHPDNTEWWKNPFCGEIIVD